MPRKLLVNMRLATMREGTPYGLADGSAVGIEGDRIAYVGREDEAPASWANAEREDLGGRLVTPALIDCHTHLVHAGDRAHEFERRLAGASYEEVARVMDLGYTSWAAPRDTSEE